MRTDARYIGIEVDDAVAGSHELAQRLAEACPVDIFAASPHGVELVAANIDECILCGLCLEAAPTGRLAVHKLYADELLEA